MVLKLFLRLPSGSQLPAHASAAPQPIPGPESAAVADVPHVRKKRRTKSTGSSARQSGKGRGKAKTTAGRLALILEMPMEIVLEILSYLMPVDILHLSYVDKELHTMLTSPTANSIWSTARRNVHGLPDCPPDFTEPAYARLLFWKTCEVCDRTCREPKDMGWVRIRLCAYCHKRHVVQGHDLLRQVKGIQEHADLKLLPMKTPYPGMTIDEDSNLLEFRYGQFFKPTALALARRLTDTDDVQELAVFRRTRYELMKAVRKHAKVLEAWISDCQTEAVQEKHDMRERRLEAIRSRMEAAGYDRRDMQSGDFTRHKIVWRAVHVSDRNWPHIRPTIEPIVQRERDIRLQREKLALNTSVLTACLQHMMDDLPTTSAKLAFPARPDLLDLPSLRDLRSATVTPEELAATFDSMKPSVQDEIEAFQARMRSDLLKLWHSNQVRHKERRQRLGLRTEGIGEPAAELEEGSSAAGARSVPFLQRASTVFACDSYACTEPLHYPTMFNHYHISATSSSSSLKSQKWAYGLYSLTLVPYSQMTMSAIIRAAGLDERSATVEDLDAIGPHFRGNSEDEQPITWQALYRSIMTQHNHDYNNSLDSDEEEPSDSDDDYYRFESASGLTWLRERFDFESEPPVVFVARDG